MNVVKLTREVRKQYQMPSGSYEANGFQSDVEHLELKSTLTIFQSFTESMNGFKFTGLEICIFL